MTEPITMDIVVPPGRALPAGLQDALVDELGVLPQVRSYKHVDSVTQALIFVVALKPFWDGLATRVGQNVGDLLSEPFIRIFKRVPDPKYLADAETGTEVRVDDAFLASDRALGKLREIDFSNQAPGTRLRWDERHGHWRIEEHDRDG